MAPATKLTPRTAEEQEKWDKDIAERVEALGIIRDCQRPDTFNFKENTKSLTPGERESIGKKAAKVNRWDAKPIAKPGKEPKVEGKKPMGKEEDVFVDVDLNDDEDYEMVEKEEAEIAEWEEV